MATPHLPSRTPGPTGHQCPAVVSPSLGLLNLDVSLKKASSLSIVFSRFVYLGHVLELCSFLWLNTIHNSYIPHFVHVTWVISLLGYCECRCCEHCADTRCVCLCLHLSSAFLSASSTHSPSVWIEMPQRREGPGENPLVLCMSPLTTGVWLCGCLSPISLPDPPWLPWTL